jgi:RNA recognition motif-containing protein
MIIYFYIEKYTFKMIKIFVGGFPLDITELELVQLISPYAEVSTIKIVRDKISRKCKGYAFLEVTDESGADRAIEALDGSAMQDRILSIKKVEEKPEQPVWPKQAFKKQSFQSNAPKAKRPRRII